MISGPCHCDLLQSNSYMHIPSATWLYIRQTWFRNCSSMFLTLLLSKCLGDTKSQLYMSFFLFIPGLWGLSRIGAHMGSTYNGSGVKVYILDTGIDYNHNEFSQEKNAYWAYTSRLLADTENKDLDGHGTHVAGTVAGKNTGVAKGAEIHAVKVCANDSYCPLNELIDGVTWVCGDEHEREQDRTGLARPKVKHVH